MLCEWLLSQRTYLLVNVGPPIAVYCHKPAGKVCRNLLTPGLRRMVCSETGPEVGAFGVCQNPLQKPVKHRRAGSSRDQCPNSSYTAYVGTYSECKRKRSWGHDEEGLRCHCAERFVEDVPRKAAKQLPQYDRTLRSICTQMFRISRIVLKGHRAANRLFQTL